jgi:hypothetical protein
MAFVKDAQKQVVQQSINVFNVKKSLPTILMAYVLNVQK